MERGKSLRRVCVSSRREAVVEGLRKEGMMR